MTKKKSTKRALISSLLILAMCFTMLAGTTFAWFTDSVESGSNIIKSGKLDIDLLIKADGDQAYVSVEANPNKAAFNYDKWEPGYTAWTNAKVVNKGNLALKYTMKIAANGEVSALADVIDVYYAASEKNIDKTDRAASLAQLTKIGTLRQAIDGTIVINDSLLPDEEDFATIALHMQETAGNEYQNLSIGAGFKFQILATQFTYEADAFDDQYDVNAEFPTVANVANATEFTTAMANPDVDKIVLDENVALPTELVINEDKTIDLGGNALTAPYLDVYGDVTFENGKVETTTYINEDAHVVIAETATVGKTDDYGVIVYQDANNSADNVLDIYGKVEGVLWVMGNIDKGDTVINLYGTVDTTEDVAVALNGKATLNVYDGAVVKSTTGTGIEVRAGNLNVYGGTIEGNGAFAINPNGSGTTTTGCGIAVCQHTTKLPINVNISGGTITGSAYGLYEANPQQNDPYGPVVINVTGGTITGGTQNIVRL